MKNVIKLLGFLILFATAFACSDDDKEDEQINPCATITCENNGICNGSGCDCPAGFTGDRCQTRLTPAIVEITRITIKEFPNTNGNGESWDANGGAPDIYFVLFNNASTIFYQQSISNRFENAISPGNYAISLSPAVRITNLTEPLNYGLYDYDSLTSDDFLGGVSTPTYTTGDTFNRNPVLSFGGFTFQLEVNYIF